jgi:hypothetical protein
LCGHCAGITWGDAAKELLVSWFSVHHLNRRTNQLAALVLLAALLYAGAGVGMAYAAGFDAVKHRLEGAEWWWVAPAFAAVALAYCGYYLAYRCIARAEGGPRIEPPSLLAVVTAGFGGFLAREAQLSTNSRCGRRARASVRRRSGFRPSPGSSTGSSR